MAKCKRPIQFDDDEIPAKSAKPRKVGESPALRPHPGIPLNKETIRELILKYEGNLSRVADAMGTTRGCVRRVVDSDPDLQAILADARERLIDEVEESVFQRAAESNDTGLQCFVLKTQGRHRGWEQDDNLRSAKDIATEAFKFIVMNQSKNPAECQSTIPPMPQSPANQ